MRFRSRVSWIVVALMLMTALAGCGASTPAPAPAPAPAQPAPTPDAPVSYKGQTLRVATFGGVFGEWVKAKIGDPLEAATGAKVEYIAGNPRNFLTQLVAARGQAPPFDIVLLDDAAQEQAIRDGFLESIDHSKVPVFKEIFKEAITAQGHGPAFYMTSIGLVYNTKKFEELGLKAPQTLGDLFDPKLKGRVAVPDMNVAMGPFGLIAASYLAGSDDKNLEPGIKKMAELNPYLYKDSSDMATRLTNGDMWAGWWIDGQVRTLARQGVPVAFVRPKVGTQFEGMSNFGTTNIVKGTKVSGLALEFVKQAYKKEVQVSMGVDNGYNPVHIVAAEEVVKDPKFANEYVADPAKVAKIYRMNNNNLNVEFPKWVDLWNRTLKK